MEEFVRRDFDVPRRLETPQFVLELLDPEHNDQDYDAWTSSGEHIHATPGWEDSSWPREMTPDENRADLQRHADDFRNRTGFTYAVEIAARDRQRLAKKRGFGTSDKIESAGVPNDPLAVVAEIRHAVLLREHVGRVRDGLV